VAAKKAPPPPPPDGGIDARLIVDAPPDAHVYDCPDGSPSGCASCGPLPPPDAGEFGTQQPECIFGRYCFDHPEEKECVEQCSTGGCWDCAASTWYFVSTYDNDFCGWLAGELQRDR
jgi:hypothetical protein